MIEQITIVTHTRNSQETLPKLLATTAWAGARIVVDMASTDETRSIARQAGCVVLDAPVVDAVDSVRNDYLGEPKTEWTFVLDSDEHLADDAEEAVATILRQYGKAYDAIGIPRYNSIAGHVMRGSGWYPDHQTRLFRTGHVRWQPGHHRLPLVKGGDARLKLLEPEKNLHIHHYSYTSLEAFMEKQLRYARTDSYDMDPAAFDFGDYIAEAYAEYNRRFDREKDGDLSAALATIMAWDRIVRGIIHWEKLGRRPELARTFSLPIATVPPPKADPEEAVSKRDRKKPSGKLRAFSRWTGRGK